MQTIQLEIKDDIYKKILKNNIDIRTIMDDFFLSLAQDLKLNKKIVYKVLDK
jgi:hypothetical protein